MPYAGGALFSYPHVWHYDLPATQLLIFTTSLFLQHRTTTRHGRQVAKWSEVLQPLEMHKALSKDVIQTH